MRDYSLDWTPTSLHAMFLLLKGKWTIDSRWIYFFGKFRYAFVIIFISFFIFLCQYAYSVKLKMLLTFVLWAYGHTSQSDLHAPATIRWNNVCGFFVLILDFNSISSNFNRISSNFNSISSHFNSISSNFNSINLSQ